MWEGVNQRDSADFENDIIASTNEVTYTRAHFKQALFDNSYINERVFEEDITIFGDNDDQDDDDIRDLSLDLDVADFLAEGNPMPPMQRQEDANAEVYAGERSQCSNCGEEAEDDNAQESTFVENISYLPEPEQSLEMRSFDHTFDNMSFSQFDKCHTSILPRCQVRNRIGSEAPSPVQTGKVHSRLFEENPIGSDEPETIQINTCIKPVSCRTPSAQISSFYESRFESLLETDCIMPSQFYSGNEDQ